MDFSQKLLQKGLAIIVALLVMQILAFFVSPYETYWWYDDIAHFLGGIFIALSIAALFFRFFHSVPSPAFILMLVVIIGLGWEVFEYVWQAIIKVEGLATPINSVQDLVADIVGGIFGIFFVQSAKKRYNKTNAR